MSADACGAFSANASSMTEGDAAVTEPSETARLIAELLPSLPKRTVADLGRLLQRRLTMFDNRALRYARLGLLIDMVSSGTGEVPSTATYEAERERRALSGESWPVHSTLSVAYGGWVRAVRAAMLLWRDGSSSRTAASNHHYGDRPPYRHDEATQALLSCRQTLGVWPSEGEYDDWRRLSRELARCAGRPEPRLPSRGAWVRLFGSWEAYDLCARRAAGARCVAGAGSQNAYRAGSQGAGLAVVPTVTAQTAGGRDGNQR